MSKTLDSITFKIRNTTYSVTRLGPHGKIHASKTLRGKRLRGRPRHFNAAEVGNLTVKSLRK